MSLVKISQNLEGVDVSEDRLADLLKEELDVNDLRIDSDADIEEVLEPEEIGDDEIVLSSEHLPTDISVIELSDEDLPELQDEVELDFTLDHIPGAESQDEIEEEKEPDPLDGFLEHIHQRMQKKSPTNPKGIPVHPGDNVIGVDRAIKHLKGVLSEISDGVSSDEEGKLDLNKLEKARDEIMKAIERLEERKNKLEKKKGINGKKKASLDNTTIDLEGIEKTAQKIVGINGGITVTVPIFIHTLAATCINATVSAGRDIEDVFEKLCEKFKLSDREKYELQATIDAMGQPLRIDRGFDVGEDVDQESSDNVEWSTEWPG